MQACRLSGAASCRGRTSPNVALSLRQWECWRVIPETLDGLPCWINPDYLTRIVDAAKDVNAGFTFGFGGTGSSLAQIGQDMVAVVMPMRLELTTDATRAAWAKDTLPQPVFATVSPDVAAMIDPSGTLQDAGLVTVSA